MDTRTIYITQAGTLARKDNTLFFSNATTKKAIPITHIDTIYCLAEVTIHSKLLAFLAKENITIHFCNYHEYYIGSFVPKAQHVSGTLLLQQVAAYNDTDRRLYIARRIVESMGHNMLTRLAHYQRHNKNVAPIRKRIQHDISTLQHMCDIHHILSVEGGLRQNVYSSFDTILQPEFVMEYRSRRPPHNPLNAMISFGNSLLYTYTLNKIYRTQLNPTIAYLHAPSTRRFSLALDLCEVFKIPLVLQTICYLINKKIIHYTKHFDQSLNAALLNDEGRIIFCRERDKRIHSTIQHPLRKKNVSYGTLILYDCYKLIKYCIEDAAWKPFRMYDKM